MALPLATTRGNSVFPILYFPLPAPELVGEFLEFGMKSGFPTVAVVDIKMGKGQTATLFINKMGDC